MEFLPQVAPKGDATALDAVTRALGDEDAQVRRFFFSGEEGGGERPRELLRGFILFSLLGYISLYFYIIKYTYVRRIHLYLG